MSGAHRSTLDHVLVSLMSVAVGVITLSMVALLATAWWPRGPLTQLEIRVVAPPRAQGDLLVEVTYCKAWDLAPAEVRWALIDGVTIMLPPYTVTLDPGCHTRVVSLPLARAIAPGVYQLQVTGIYELWPWRHEVYIRTSPPFRLLPAEVP
jgi:hypothetical protein